MLKILFYVIVGLIFLAALVSVGLPAFLNPELTQTQLLTRFWYHYLFTALLAGFAYRLVCLFRK